MKKQEPQESANEKMLGKVIAAELRQQLLEAESDCPETEIVAAFYDRTLSDRERAVWEKHFLKCLRCQEYLAEMARLSDADEPPPLPHEAGKDEAKEQSGGWFYRLAWVVPFLIISAISAIWYREEISNYIPSRSETAENIPEPAVPAGQTPPGPKAGGEESREKASKDFPLSAANRPVSKSKEEAGRSAQALPAPASAGQGAMAALRDRANVTDAARVQKQAAQIAALEKKSAAGAPAAPPAPAKPERESAVAEADSAKARSDSSLLGGISIRGARQLVETKWRVGRRGSIQKADGAGGWTRIASGVDDDLFDITFEGSTGWAVGHGGTVLRSPDGGNSWQKVAAPTTEDLVHVSSAGTQQATVIARSGKVFSTSDGGRTWK